MSVVGLIVCIIIVTFVVYIAKHGPKKALILIPIVVGVAVFVPLMSYKRATSVASFYQVDLGLQQDMQTQSAIWNEAVDDYLAPEQNPSMEDAARFLAKKLASEFKGTDNWHKMLIFGKADTTRESLDVFSDTIRSQLNLDDVEVMLHRPRVLPDDPNVILCDLAVLDLRDSHTVVNGLPIHTRNGTLRMQIENPTQIMDRAVGFLEKDWVNSLSTLQHQGHSAVVVARSGGSCLDETEAQDQAMGQAATMVENLLRQSNQDPSILSQEIKVTPQDLRANGLVADQFTQSLRTSTARVWRHAVLLNLDPREMQTLLQQKTRQIQQMHKSWAKDLISLAGLALVVFILYIFLNAATKGYYAWSLRVIAMVTIMGIVVVLFLT